MCLSVCTSHVSISIAALSVCLSVRHTFLAAPYFNSLVHMNDAVVCHCRFNYRAALLCIASCSPDITRMRAQAESAQSLMEFYGAELPSVSTPSPRTVQLHEPSASLLKDTNPWMLTKYIPAQVGADGNCLFRSVSYALYDTEVHHVHLRLLCVIEALLHEQLYNGSSVDFYGPYAADKWLCLPAYDSFVCNVCVDGSYSDMLSVLALSTVIQKPIQTVWPLYVAPGAQSPYTKFVMGSGITSTNHPVYVLWTVCTYEGINSGGVDINHFVPLIERPVDAQYVTLIDDATDPLESNATHSVNSAQAMPQQNVTASDDTDNDSDVCVNHDCRNESVGNSPHVAGMSSDHFLSFTECVNCMESCAQTVPEIPDGPKNNVYFLVDQTRNLEREATGKRREFRDDCGVWESVRSRTVYLEKPSLRQVFLKNGAYCARKVIKGKSTTEPLQAQPPNCEIVALHQYVSRLNLRAHAYERRVTCIPTVNHVALVEYIGTFPDHVTNHGNANTGGEYIRSKPEVLEKIRTSCKSHASKPKHIYTGMQLNAETECDKPRNLKQVQNMSVKEMSTSQNSGKGNLADDIQSLCNDVTQSDFVQGVFLVKGHAPSVVLYTHEQISDLLRFCGGNAVE